MTGLSLSAVAASAVAAPQDVVVTGVRHAAPTDAPPPLTVYAQPRKFEQVALSPDGAQVAFITDYFGVRLLIAYRLADHSRRMVRLGAGDIAALSWADPDHVLVSAMRPAVRGTCDARDEQTLIANMMAAQSSMDAVVANLESSSPQGMGPSNVGPSSPPNVNAVMQLGGRLRASACVYYGVRGQYVITSINLAKHTGHDLGLRFGDTQSLPLALPQPIPAKGEPRLIGPYIELRAESIGDQPAERDYLWSVDPQADRARLVDDGGGDIERVAHYVDDWLVDPQGQIVARSVYDYDTAQFSLQMKREGRWKPVLKRTIDPKQHTQAPSLVGLGHEDGSIIILDAADGDKATAAGPYHYYQLSAAGVLSGPLEPDDVIMDRPLFNPRTGRLAGFARSGETETYALSDPELATLYDRAQAAAPGESVRVVAVAADPRKLVIRAQGREDPGSYFFIDYSTGASLPLGEDYADLPTEWMAAQTSVSYKAADGLTLHALLTLPPKPKPDNLPLIVLPHDGPQGHDAQDFDWLAQALASRGYAVLQPNYRGSDGYGPALVAAGAGQWGRAMQTDLSDGVREMVAEGIADPKRVCILGAGYGGYAALDAAATQSDIYRCAAAINAVSDPAAYIDWRRSHLVAPVQDKITTLLPAADASRALNPGADSPGVLSTYLGAAGLPTPLAQAGRFDIPTLLISESNDPETPAHQSQAMADALTAEHKPVQYVKLKGDDHSLAAPDVRLAALTAVMAFLAQNNPADAPPAKPAS